MRQDALTSHKKRLPRSAGLTNRHDPTVVRRQPAGAIGFNDRVGKLSSPHLPQQWSH